MSGKLALRGTLSGVMSGRVRRRSPYRLYNDNYIRISIQIVIIIISAHL